MQTEKKQHLSWNVAFSPQSHSREQCHSVSHRSMKHKAICIWALPSEAVWPWKPNTKWNSYFFLVFECRPLSFISSTTAVGHHNMKAAHQKKARRLGWQLKKQRQIRKERLLCSDGVGWCTNLHLSQKEKSIWRAQSEHLEGWMTCWRCASHKPQDKLVACSLFHPRCGSTVCWSPPCIIYSWSAERVHTVSGWLDRFLSRDSTTNEAPPNSLIYRKCNAFWFASGNLLSACFCSPTSSTMMNTVSFMDVPVKS